MAYAALCLCVDRQKSLAIKELEYFTKIDGMLMSAWMNYMNYMNLGSFITSKLHKFDYEM